MQTTQHTKPVSMPAPSLMTVTQAADYLGLAVSTLNKWRCHGGGPVFIKMGRSVRYRIVDLNAFMASRLSTSTSNYGEAE